MSWNCANDSGDSAKIDPPPEQFIVARGAKDFAEGNGEAILAKGGPRGAYVWAHLHGEHHDRFGESNYSLVYKVEDASKYLFHLGIPLSTTVEGVLDKPVRHRHCYIQDAPPPGQIADDLKGAIDNNIPLNVVVEGERDRDLLKWLEKLFEDIADEALKALLQEFVKGEVNVSEVIAMVNKGKTRPF
ncbi:hypothetical protein AB4Z03_25565 [Bacillus sp. YAF12_1]|uniref:hypothetical protein n=1 Tax=Bacillus sp. YAF12_1 TaxID=3237484 RepID=UPI003734313F